MKSKSDPQWHRFVIKQRFGAFKKHAWNAIRLRQNDIKVAFLGTETKDNKLSLSRLETVLERKSITGLKYSDNEILSTFIFVSAQREVVNSGFQLLNDTLLQKDLILIDDQSRICGFYTSTDDRAVQQLLNEIGVLIQEQSQK